MHKSTTHKLPTSDKILRIERMVEAIFQNIRFGLRTEAALESANDIVLGDERLQHGKVRGHQCYDAVRESMAMHLALILSRLYDGWAPHNPETKKDVNSIPLMLGFIREADVRKELGDRARRWVPLSNDFADEQEKSCFDNIDASIREYDRFSESPEGKRGLSSLKEFRNCVLAHSLQKQMRTRPPIYGDLFLLMKVAAIIGEHAHFAIRGHNNGLTRQAEIDRAVSDEFWKRALPATILRNDETEDTE